MNGALAILLVTGCLTIVVSSQPLYGFEKALLYSFEDPRDIEFISPKEETAESQRLAVPAKRRTRFLNLMGQNTRFLKPFVERREREEKIRAERASTFTKGPDCRV